MQQSFLLLDLNLLMEQSSPNFNGPLGCPLLRSELPSVVARPLRPRSALLAMKRSRDDAGGGGSGDEATRPRRKGEQNDDEEDASSKVRA